jgi:Ca2+-binding RTX toxin-like protein
MTLSVPESLPSGASIVFIDSRITNLELVVSGLAAGTRWVLIDTEQDGLTQIAAALQGTSNLQSIQVLSHGGPGSLLLGSGSITSSTLQSQAALLASIGAALAPDGDLLLYGCNVAQGDAGAEFIALLAQLTGADVAASTDLTGDTALDGDWALEASTGAIESTGIALTTQASEAIGVLANFTGTTGNDSILGTIDPDTIWGLAGNDTLDGGDGNDTLEGADGNDSLKGGPGNDDILNGTGIDTLDGGDGSDTLSLQAGGPTLTGVSIDLQAGIMSNDGFGNSETVSSIENIGGTSLDDSIRMGNFASGQGGYVFGSGGNDSIVAATGAGWNSIYPGSGNDTIVAPVGVGNASVRYDITDWDPAGAPTRGIAVNLTTGVLIDVWGFTDQLVGMTTVAGSALNDSITGNELNNSLEGWGGDDVIFGAAGNDTLQSGAGNDTLYGGDGNDTLDGGSEDDLLDGGMGNDLFRPGAGSDTITGGPRWTVFYNTSQLPSDSDTLNYYSSAGTQINLSTRTVTVNGESGVDQFDGIERIDGGRNTSDTITGALLLPGQAPVLSWMSLYLNGGNDTVIQTPYGQPAAFFNGVFVYYDWSSTGISLNYINGDTATVSYGASGTQLAGTDTLQGVTFLGDTRYNDTFNITNQVTNHLGYITNQQDGTSWSYLMLGRGGSDTIIANGNAALHLASINQTSNGLGVYFTLGSGVADLSHLQANWASPNGTLTYSGVYAIAATPFNDTLIGGVYDDYESFRGQAGDDFINGGAGYDRSDYSVANEGVTILLATGTASSASSGNDTLRSIEEIRGSSFADTFDATGFTGGGTSTTQNLGSFWWGYNFFSGDGGNDTISGNGATRLNYSYSLVPIVVDLASGYSDARLESDRTTIDYVMSLGRDNFSGVEGVVGSSFDDLLLGGGPGQTIAGNAIEWFNGGAGNDTIDGRSGFDIASYSGSGAGITVDKRLATGQVLNDGWGYTDTLFGIERVTASRYDDSLRGSDWEDDTFDGLRGQDTIDGGGGYDEVGYDSDEAGVTVSLALGIAIDGWGGVDTLTNIEGVEGSAYNDQIVGNSGNNRLDGRGGNDTLDGGDGNDWVEYNQALQGVHINLTLGRAFDDGQGIGSALQNAAIEQDTLIGFENVLGGAGNDSIVGDAGANQLEGAAGNDTLRGDAGNDSLYGANGDDLLIGGTGNDYFESGDGSDTIDASPVSNVPWSVSGSDYDTLSYRPTAGTTINLSTRTVSVTGQSGADTYLGVERIEGASNATDLVTGRTSGSVLDFETGGSGIELSLNGGSDRVSLEGYGYQQYMAGGPTINYSWSQTGLLVNFVGAVGQVAYGASGTQASGIDTLINIGNLAGSRFNDLIDVSGFTVNHMGYITQPYDELSWNSVRTGLGGSDTVVGNGATSVGLWDVSNSSNGLGAYFDLAQGQSNLSHLSSWAGGLGTLSYSGLWGVSGTKFADTLIGGANDAFETFSGGGGDDLIDGGRGYDRAGYSSATTGMVCNLASGSVSSSSEGTDTLRSIEEIRGTRFDDTFDATGFVGGGTSTTANVGSYWWGLNSFIDIGGNDLIIGNGSTRVDYRNSAVAIHSDFATGLVDARVVSDKASVLYATLGRDTVSGAYAIWGSEFDDLLEGGGTGHSLQGAPFEVFRGEAGNDTINGRTGSDIATYTSSPNAIVVDMRLASGQVINDGWGFSDTLLNIEGIQGTAFADSVRGSDSTSARLGFRGEKGNDSFDGGAGRSEVEYANDPEGIVVRLAGWVAGAGSLTAGFTGSALDGWGDIDVFRNVAGVEGSSYSDIIVGDAFDNTIDGRGGSDFLDGGAGIDHLEFNNTAYGVHVDLAQQRVFDDGQATGSWSHPLDAVESDTVIGFENVLGGYGNDSIVGDTGANDLQGSFGNDTLIGGGGNDTLIGGSDNDLLDGEAGADIAGFRGNRASYSITANSDGSVSVADTRNSSVEGFDGTDTLRNIETLRFADGDVSANGTTGFDLSGIAYHWKSHMLLNGVDASVRSQEASETNGPPAVLDLRNAVVSTEAGTGNRIVTVQVWANAQAGDANFDFRVTSSGALSASFTTSVGSGWSVISSLDAPNQVAVAGFDAGAGFAAGPVQLGTLSLAFASSASRTDLAFSQISLGQVFGPNLAFVMASDASNGNGQWDITNLPGGSYNLTASRATPDTGNAITSADALAALRIAVGLNPNTDPDGPSGPLQPLRVSPYQFMAADVNGSNTVTSADALAILRMAVKLSTALPDEWFFVEESRDFWNEATNRFTLTNTNTTWDRTIPVDLTADRALNLVGGLKGDVNGSWAAPAGSIDLDTGNPNYFTNLATSLGMVIGSTPVTDQWGI